MDDTLIQFKQIIDEEIEAYEALGELYKIKQSILVQGKSDLLMGIDAQIVSKADFIKGLNARRKNVAKYLGDENLTMSEIIEKANEANESIIAGELKSQQNKIKILANSLNLQEKTNLTLIQHGLTMVGKTLEIIVDAFVPQATKQYDKSGRDVKSYEELVSSIVEEA